MERVLTNARIFDGFSWHENSALLLSGGKVSGIKPMAEMPSGPDQIDANGATIVPGFIDLQVNGGGGVMLNDDQSVEGIRQICSVHARFGTTALLPTLITDTPEITAAAIKAGLDAKDARVPGFMGLHLEGPHLSVARKGTHHPALIRPMEDADLQRLLAVADKFDALMITVAPENTTVEQVKSLSAAGFIVSLGHTNATYETAKTYSDAGARVVTHLFNAMSPLENRSPGLVGAALDLGQLSCGIIADGSHVHPAAMGAAIRAKRRPGNVFIVTDAMSTIGTQLDGFLLNGRQIHRSEGRLTLADGTLAGANIDMLSSILFVHKNLGIEFSEAIRMATVYPAQAAGVCDRKGSLKSGFDADFVLLDDDHKIDSTWISGKQIFTA